MSAEVEKRVENETETVTVKCGNVRDGFHEVRFEGRELARHVGRPAPGVAYEPNPAVGFHKPEPHETYSWSLWKTRGGRFALHLVAPAAPGGQLIVAESWGYLRRAFGIPEEVAAAVTPELLRDRVVVLDA